MIGKTEMLNSIAQNAELGCCGIANIKRYAADDKLKKALRTQIIEYGKIHNCANNMLRTENSDLQRISPVVRKMTRHMAKQSMQRDSSDSHIAQMMIKGNLRGVSKITDKFREYDKSDSKVEALAKRLMATEYNNIQQMTDFL